MTDKKHEKSQEMEADDQNVTDCEPKTQLTSRRKFAKSGIAGSAVLMSLMSRPSFGMGPKHKNDAKCTASILASIDAGTSLHDFDPDKCRFGCTPGFWCEGQPSDGYAWDWVRRNVEGMVEGSATEFKDVFGVEPAPEGVIGTYFPAGTSLQAILCIPNGEGPAFAKQSARHAIAALLNAHILGVYYAPEVIYAPVEIIAKYVAARNLWTVENDVNIGTEALDIVHQEFAALNERGDCPLDSNKDNLFYKDPYVI